MKRLFLLFACVLLLSCEATKATDNPWAVQQAFAGPRIDDLQVYDGQVWAGFGDWNHNTGPIMVSSWDPVSHTWTEHGLAATEAIDEFSVTSQGLIVPYIDPRGPYDYATTLPLDQHSNAGTAESFFHVFDVVEHDGSLWAIGTQRATSYGLVMRSTDDGETWSESLVSSGPDGYDYFTNGTVLDGSLYIQGREQAWRFDGTTWVSAPMLYDGLGWAMGYWCTDQATLGDRSVCVDKTGNVRVTDGSELVALLNGVGVDLYADGPVVYGIQRDLATGGRKVVATLDLVTWATLDIVIPDNTTSIAVSPTHFWFGTATGGLWSAPR